MWAKKGHISRKDQRVSSYKRIILLTIDHFRYFLFTFYYIWRRIHDSDVN